MKKKCALLIIVMFTIAGLYAEEVRGLTCSPLAEPVDRTGLRAALWRGETAESIRHIDDFDREGWELADSIQINTFLPAGEHIAVSYTGYDNKLTVEQPADGLTYEAKDALDKSPVWIRAELETTLRQLEEEEQIFWANVINEVDDPIIDEVAFCIATSSYDYLTGDFAYPELFIENAEMIYEYDQELSYVEVIDYGNSVTDEDYYSTTSYWSKDANGLVHQTEVPRDIYYWHIVHHKITDEIPAYINPDLLESNSTHDTNIVGPGEGYLWRDFLYNYADEGYPVLRNYLIQCEYANDYTTGYESAIGACTQWLSQSLQFTSNFERPHQPVRIYRKHIGRCGEHADMRVAIGRIALVPMTSIVCFTVDHTWNEFWDGEWIHWDGGSINNFYMYEQGWGSNFGSVIDVRSDGLMTPVTDKYAPNYADLNVYILDGNGNPIDGARVVIGLILNNQISGDMVGWTDNEGKYSFTIGDGHEYYAAVSCPLGTLDYQLITENTAGGDVYDMEMQLTETLPQLVYNEIDVPPDDDEDYRLVVQFEADQQIIYGNIVMDDTSEDTWFYNRRQQGAVNFFMCDFVHYCSYLSSLEFEAFNAISESDFGIYDFAMPEPLLGSWHGVIDNRNNITNPQWVTANIALYHWDGCGGSGIISGSVMDAASGEPVSDAQITAGGFSTNSSADGLFSLEVYPNTYSVIFDHPLYERIRINDVTVENGGNVELSAELSDNPIKPLNLTVTGDDVTSAVISWDAPSSLMGRSLLGYHVFRLLSEDEFNPENWQEITAGLITETTFTDNDWLNQEAGEYRFAVCAEYSEFSSDYAVSPEVPLYMAAELELELVTNSGDTAAGAIIYLANTDEVNSPYNYEFIYPEEGTLQAEMRKGNYDIEISLENFETYEDSISFFNAQNMQIELIELLKSATFAGVVDYQLNWDAVPQNRQFQEYCIYLDNETEPFSVSTLNSCDLTDAGAGEHIAAIEAVYTSGSSPLAEINFNDGSSLNYEKMAYFSLNENFTDEISGWQGTSATVNLSPTPFGMGAEFNGADFITVPVNEELINSALHYSISFWMNPENENSGWCGLLGRPGRNHCAWLNSDNHYIHHRFHSSNGGTNDGAPNTPNGSIDYLEWQYITIVNDGITAKTYINGELLAEGSVNGSLLADSTDFYIGKSPDSPTAQGYFFGIIDEINFWNRGLAEAEIQHLYLQDTELLGYGTLSGLVTDLSSGNPLAEVEIKAGIFHTESLEDGSYEIDLPAGIHDISFSLGNYMIQFADDVVITADETTILDFSYELTDNDNNEIIPEAVIQINSYPNPALLSGLRSNDIYFDVNFQGSPQPAELSIYNLKGQKVYFRNINLISGKQQLSWNGKTALSSSVSSGLYFYIVKTEELLSRGKFIILR